MDGQIDLYDANAALNSDSWMHITLPNTPGNFNLIVVCKATRQADDNSDDDALNFIFQMANAGSIREYGVCMEYKSVAPTKWAIRWQNNAYQGVVTLVNYTMTPGQEYELAMVMTSEKIIYMINGIPIGYQLVGNKGTCPMSATQRQLWFASNKALLFGARHAANRICHWRIRSIRVSHLVGISSM
jgi:hypothetical protein